MKNFMKMMAPIAILAIAATVQADQTRVIKPSKQFKVPVTAISSTYDVQPQIPLPLPFTIPEVAAENEYTPPLPPERRVRMALGGILAEPRGQIKSYFPGPVDGRWIPPDPNMGVGPNHVVCIINSKIAFYTKTGTKTFEQLIDTSDGFFQGTAQTNFVFDPKAFYDPIANRFFVVALDLNTGSTISNALVAVSDDSNPNGTWYKYRIPAVLSSGGSTFWMDYPGFGFNKDGIIVTGNMFGFAGGYYGVQGLVVRKSDLLTGGTAQVSSLLDPGIGTVQPTRTTDAANPFIFGVSAGGGNAMRLYAVSNPGGTSPTWNQTNVSVSNFQRPPGAAPSGNNTIDSLDGRTMSAAFRNGQIVSAHTIGLNGVDAVRWYDFNVNNWPTSGSPTVRQQGNITGSSGQWMHMPAININQFEDISICFTRSSATIPADLMFAARLKTDPNGFMGAPQVLDSSLGSNYQSFRWGDYFACEIDPEDDSTFWGFGMNIDANGGYRTIVKSWTVSTGGVVGDPIDADSITTYTGTYVFGDVDSVRTSDGIFYTMSSLLLRSLGQAAGAELTFTAPVDSVKLSVALQAIADQQGVTQMVWLYNWTTDAYDLIGTAPVPTTNTDQKVFKVADAAVSKYLGVGGLVKMRVRAHVPVRLYQGLPLPFNYQIDYLELYAKPGS